MEHIVFLERNTFTVDFRKPDFDHEWIEYAETLPSQVVERLKDATIVISNKLALRKPELSHLPQLKLIAIAATGTDNVDLEYCCEHKIAVCNTRGYAVNSVPEHVLMLVLALRRNLLAYREDVRRGDWQRAKQFCLLKNPIHDLQGSTIGIIGWGSIGRATSRLAQAIGMRVLVAERKGALSLRAGRTQFQEVLRQSDIVTLHCPLNDETNNLISTEQLRLMKREAVLINTARGGLVNEAALVRALQSGLIAGAGFDVLSNEPPREGNALLDLDLPNFILTPHVAWASEEAMRALLDQLISNIEAFVRGEPQNLVV